MLSLPKEYASRKGFLIHAVAVPLFVFVLLLLFSPVGFHHFSLPFDNYSRYSFHVTMVFCIILVAMALSRTALLLFNRNQTEVTWGRSFLFCLLEIIASSGFTALYLWLVSGKAEAYFWFFGVALVYLTVLMVIPYSLIDLYFIVLAKNDIITDKERDLSKEKIRFMDERNNLKLVVTANAVLYIQSEENYLKICYLEYNDLKFCTIRSSMKRIEALCERNGLVRCHRSYFVNKTHVQALQKDKEFSFAVLDVPAANRVPVSKNYYDQITSLL